MAHFILLPDKFVEQLAKEPESGMGYHLVDVKLKDGRFFQRQVVLNGNEFHFPEWRWITGKDIESINIHKQSNQNG